MTSRSRNTFQRVVSTVVLASLLMGAQACEEPRSWDVEITSVGDADIGFGAAAASDVTRRRLFILNGREGREIAFQECRHFDFASKGMKSGPRVDDPPGPLFMPCCAIDSKRDTLYLFGGWRMGATSPEDGMWKVSLGASSPAWVRIDRKRSWPPARNGATMVYSESADSLVLFGGDGGPGRFGFTPLGDLWRFDVAGAEWSRVKPAGSPPPARWNQMMAIAEDGKRCYLFGGAGVGTGENEVFDRNIYELDLETWSWTRLKIEGTRPPSLQGATFTYDRKNEALLLAGGLRHRPPGPATCSDLWLFDLRARRWEMLPGNQLTTRRDHVAGYDPESGSHCMLGGRVSSQIGNFYDPGRPQTTIARVRLQRAE